MKNKLMKKISFLFCLAFLLCLMVSGSFPANAYAKTLPCKSATATGSYSHPHTGIIEDSGGESSKALGQSMVSNVVDTNALIETLDTGDYLFSIRFHLMNSLSDIRLYTQMPGDTSWKSISFEQTASGDDTGDFRFQVSDTDTIIKAECKVDAMGRYVVFYITLSNFTDGNSGHFVQMEVPETPASTQDYVEPDSEKEAAFETESEAVSEIQSESDVVSSSDPLRDAEGLSIGGSATSKTTSISEEATPTAANAKLSPQELNISASVWFMLFVILFCSQLLAGLALLGCKYLISCYCLKKAPSDDDADTDTYEAENGDLDGFEDFEALDDFDLEENTNQETADDEKM